MLLPVREAITASRELAMEQILRYQWTWCVPWCSGRGLVGGVVFIVASSWVTAAVVAELSGRHVRNLCLRSERRAAGSAAQRRGSGRLAAETPVLSERPLCGAEQVSPEQLSPSLEANTLWIIVIYPQGATSMLRSGPGCPSALPPFFSVLPSCQHSSSHQLACLLWCSFNQTAQWLRQVH